MYKEERYQEAITCRINAFFRSETTATFPLSVEIWNTPFLCAYLEKIINFIQICAKLNFENWKSHKLYFSSNF